MKNRIIKQYIDSLLGQKLLDITCEADLLDIGFENRILHISSQALGRVLKNNKILVTTLDYQSWDEKESVNNDEWYNVDRYRQDIVGGIVISVKKSRCGDLFIKMSNGIRIEVLIGGGEHHYGDHDEQWVLFDKRGVKETLTFLTVFNDEIDYDELNIFELINNNNPNLHHVDESG